MSPAPDAGGTADAHVVQLYDDRRSLVEAVTASTSCALLHGEAALVLATPDHRAELAEALTRGGLAVGRLRLSGQYAELDAESVLAWATGRDGELDATLLIEALDDQLGRQTRRWRRVCVYSDLVSCLWGRGDVLGTLRLEGAWNELVRTRPLRLHCGYDSARFADSGSADQALQVLTAHSEVRAT